MQDIKSSIKARQGITHASDAILAARRHEYIAGIYGTWDGKYRGDSSQYRGTLPTIQGDTPHNTAGGCPQKYQYKRILGVYYWILWRKIQGPLRLLYFPSQYGTVHAHRHAAWHTHMCKHAGPRRDSDSGVVQAITAKTAFLIGSSSL